MQQHQQIYFNAKTGTIFESTKLPLKKWFYAFYAFFNHKNGKLQS